MTMQAAAYGRIGQDPRSVQTRSGKPMATASLAVDVGSEDDAPLWLGVVAFGGVADELLRHKKGDLVSVSGRIQRNIWTTANGEKREQLQIVADAIVSSRSVRPSGGRRKDSHPQSDNQMSRSASQWERDDQLPL